MKKALSLVLIFISSFLLISCSDKKYNSEKKFDGPKRDFQGSRSTDQQGYSAKPKRTFKKGK